MPLRRFTTAELVLTQRLNLERPLLLLVLLGSAGFAVAEGNVFYLTFTAAGVLVNAIALRQRAEVYVPRVIVNLAVLVATAVFLAEFLRSSAPLVSVLGHYLILIQLCKLFEQKRNGDYVQIICLSAVLMIAGAVVTTGIWFAVLLAAYVPVVFYVTMALTLKSALDRQATARLAVESRPIDPHRVAWNVSAKFPRRRLWGRAWLAAGACSLIAAAVFVLMPRGRAEMFVPWAHSDWYGRTAVTGFSDVLRLRQVGRTQITADPRVVMQAAIHRDGQDLGPGGYVAYLRGRVYGTYRGGEWLAWRTHLPWWPGDLPPSTARLSGTGRTIVQQITMDPSELPTLFAVAPVLSMDLPGDMVPSGTYPNLTVERAPTNAPVRYTVRSWPQPLTQEQRRFLSGVHGHARPYPWGGLAEEVSPAIAGLARRWCADLLAGAASSSRPAGGAAEAAPDDRAVPPDPARDALHMAIARRIARRLGENYTYTLDLSQIETHGDPVEQFLFSARRGHCVFFASAMALLCRSLEAGVQVRVAAGYLTSEYSPGAGAYFVRARDAHAWCEVYTPSTDWLIVDPTPPGGRESAVPAVSRTRRLWDEVVFFWRTRVIGYGEFEREGLFGGFLRRFQAAWRAVVRGVAAGARSLWRLVTQGRVDENLLATLAVLASAAGAVVLTFLGRWAARRWCRRAREPRPAVPLPGFYRTFLRRLRRRGLRPTPDQTVREFLLSAGERLSLAPSPVRRLVELLYRLRWGQDGPAAAQVAEGQELVRELTAQLQRR